MDLTASFHTRGEERSGSEEGKAFLSLSFLLALFSLPTKHCQNSDEKREMILEKDQVKKVRSSEESKINPAKFTMKSLSHFNLFFILLLLPLTTTASHLKLIPTILHKETYHYNQRKILHQPLYPVTPAPPPGTDSPPPPDTSQFPNPDQPFFPQVPTGPTPDQNRQTPLTSSANETIPIPAATQPAEPAKKVAIAISVGIVTLGMLSALAFFLYRHRVKHPAENQKLVGENDQRFPDESRVAPSSLLYIGTVEPSGTSFSEPNGPTTCTTMNGAVSSPYHKLNSVKRSERYRPSPDLQPLSPLPKPPSEHANVYSPAPESSSDDEESQGNIFYTPQGSSISNDDGYYTPAASSCHSSMKSVNVLINGVNTNVRHSRRTSPKSRSPEMKHAIIPSIKQAQTPPPAMPLQARNEDVEATPGSYFAKRTKFSQPPPPPNMALLRSINGPESTKIIPAPPPPPPLPPSLPPMPRKMVSSESGTISTSRSWTPNKELVKPECWNSGSKVNSQNGTSETIERSNSIGGSCSERVEGDENDGSKPKLKPLHWDKVKATSDRATVWDQLKSSSFQLNEDMMESLFGCNSVNSVPKENTRKSVLPPVELENRVLDPKKSQNIAILLRALNVTQDEVPEALLDGNPERLGAELLETLVKMAPTKEEEIKLRDYNGDISKLGSADRFLKAVLDIPFAFRRVEAMLYRANFDTEVKYLRKSFEILEVASEELKNSRQFLKLLEAVLRTGNRMNVGTNRGDAKAFKLDTLLKLVDVKGTDGKTTLLHFVVQEIIRSEGEGSDTENQNGREMTQSKLKDDDFRKQGLKIVSGLSRDLSNVKKAAGMDSDVLNSYVTKLEMGLENVRAVLQFEKPDMPGKFFASMKQFLRQADEEIMRIKDDEKKALSVVKEVTEYFHGNAVKEEAHPLRIFLIVRDFLNILDHVCKEVGNLQDRAVVGSARSFRISATTSLPVLNRYHMKQDKSSDEES